LPRTAPVPGCNRVRARAKRDITVPRDDDATSAIPGMHAFDLAQGRNTFTEKTSGNSRARAQGFLIRDSQYLNFRTGAAGEFGAVNFFVETSLEPGARFMVQTRVASIRTIRQEQAPQHVAALVSVNKNEGGRHVPCARRDRDRSASASARGLYAASRWAFLTVCSRNGHVSSFRPFAVPALLTRYL